jgi:tetratricopeptide (TPR) repeat protein
MTKTVFISSTALDLPEHRAAAMEACRRLGLVPDAMENWPATDEKALAVARAKVEQADIFVGIYGHRYGFIPPEETRSITELEFDHATNKKKPRLVFLMDECHAPTGGEPEPVEAQAALAAFKKRIGLELVLRKFANADRLQIELLHALFCHLGGFAFEPFQLYQDKDFPQGAERFFGRKKELAALDAAWAGGANVIELVALGGTGKTALIRDWMQMLAGEDWRGLHRAFAWSFYSQGSVEDRQASDEHFLAKALEWFQVDVSDTRDAGEKGRRLALAIAARPTLLILDGVEPLQYPPGRHLGELSGRLRAPGLQALLEHLATARPPGLVLLSTRERIQDLAGFERNPERPQGSVLRLDLENLAEEDGARLLHALGANKAGAAAIGPEDGELREACREVKGHALTLRLLGSYLAAAHGGDIRRRWEVDFQEADEETQGGHAFKVMKAYEIWFASQGEAGARELAALRLLGFFDRPASAANLAALRQAPAIPGLTEALFHWNKGFFGFFRKPLAPIKDQEWNSALHHLRAIGLLLPGPTEESLDAHPLIREYLASRLEQEQPQAWKEGHRRLYEQLKRDTPPRPDTLAGLQPLYQAVAHGCKAGLAQEACAEVYRDRILRGTGPGGFYSWKKLGAIGADLGAVACFFMEPWRLPAPELKEGDQAWLLNEAAFSLRALGRLAEALEPMRVSGEMDVRRKEWKGAAASYNNLSELELSLGRIEEAVADAGRSVEYADLSGDWSQRMRRRTTLADARHQQGKLEAARQGFAEAEAMQAKRQPDYPLLYSLQGFRYCELLLAPAERASWGGLQPAKSAQVVSDGGLKPAPQAVADVARRSEASPGPAAGAEPGPAAAPPVDARTRLEASSGLRVCAEVAKRGRKMFEWRVPGDPLLDIALDHLTLARCALYSDLLQGLPPGEEARLQCEAASSGLRAAGTIDHLPRALLTRAWLRHAARDLPGAQGDLEEAYQIASRGGMKLHLADIALTRARLFRDRNQLQLARKLIMECGYGRRLPELEDAERSLTSGSK